VAAGELRLLELFHGPTLAFKDFALSLMGDLLALAREASGSKEEILILVATSGDTGKAALQGFADRPGIRVLVFYPSQGVSGIQRLQMLTHEAANGAAVGIKGNFDDAQRGVKALFSDSLLAADLASRGIRLGSANSINIGRLVPQAAYYVQAWRDMRDRGELGPEGDFDVVVPTGNFGDALAAWYAKRMGLPLGRIIVATNENRVLDDFFRTGTCDRRRGFQLTTSPSMDILAASNLERLVFEATGRDPRRTASLMADFSGKGSFTLAPSEMALLGDFESGSATSAEAGEEIGRSYREAGYLMDPHTACAAAVGRRLGGRGRPQVIVSTASPFKFPASVSRAIGLGAEGDEVGTALALAKAAGLELPPSLARLPGLPLRHGDLVGADGLEGALRRLAGLSPAGERRLP
jgi:threonine synthase